MGEAFLDYKKGGSSFDISGIIEDYYVYAGEKVSAGDFVEFINGIAGKEFGTSTDTYLNGANTCETKPKAVELPNGNVFIVHRQRPSNAYLLYGIVCVIEGAKITAGTDTRLTSYNDSTAGVNALVLPSGDVLVSYTRSAVYGMVCKITGTTISVGTATKLHSAGSTNFHELILLSDGKFMVFYADGSSSDALAGTVCSVSGTTVTGGTFTTISTMANSGNAISPTLLHDGKVFVAHRQGYERLAGTILTVSGTTISKGTTTILSEAGYSGYEVSAQTLPSGKVFIAHSFNASYYYLYGMICSVSGTSITAGTDTVLKEASNSGRYISTAVLPDGKVFVGHSESSTNYLNGMICSISDATITAGTDVSLIPVQLAGFYFSTCLLQSGNIFIAHASYISDNRHFYAQIFGIDEENNIPTNQIAIPTYETQVRPATTLPCNGVAKSSGEGGDSTSHNQQVSIYVPELEVK